MPWEPGDKAAYAYLFGWYLGDGCVSDVGRAYQLVITCDSRYPAIIEECARALEAAVPGRRARVRPHKTHNFVRIESGWVNWPEAFPQHARGRKHERPIALELWQLAIVARYPWEFLRGLIHSDGCRTTNTFKTKLPSGRVAEYSYTRYFFSNVSADIRGLFCATCDQLGLRWTKSNRRNISISHRTSVALLDEHVGPKA
ncbi:hypothetical protein OJ997_08800 [Solirubrobacter phytolaccae]|uniref:DOD-type homing endonuclease domain-containing protein n=1 Tax=Solirubrobacter phytolaccae TaxID=1404360 RepID=A0A9X3N8J0_9ACTN|nr:hypothetical protein [Solirubrobacter phytolaccae]MDA0180390.1 hypothetical protein [Solirubrobacter phytolaccae]